MRSVVVLPHPDGPSIAKKEPRSIESVRRSTAVISPKRLVTSSRWMSGDAPRGASGSVIERAAYWSHVYAVLVPQTQRTGAPFDIPSGGPCCGVEVTHLPLRDAVGARNSAGEGTRVPNVGLPPSGGGRTDVRHPPSSAHGASQRRPRPLRGHPRT